MIITTKVTIDLQKPAFPAVVNAVQGDQNTRCLEAAFYSGGVSWEIPADAVISMRYCKPDGTKGYYDTMPDGTIAATVSDNTVSMLLAPQMLTVPGSVMAQLEIIQGIHLLGTFSFLVSVEANPAAGVVESEDYINWLQWMETELADRMNTALASGDFTGPQGPQGTPGTPASLVKSEITYQAGDSGTVIPSGTWSSGIPVVSQGKYLWTRVTNTFNTGDPVVSYSVARMGLDGSGSVSSVADISPDENGNVPLTAKDVGALPDTGGDLTGELKMNGQPLSGLNAPAANDQAANKGYVDQQVKKAAPRNLLDNSDFTNPVNQRGQTSYGGSVQYTIDRWKTTNNNTELSVDSGGITITNTVADSAGYLLQVIENPSRLLGKTLTLAAKINGNVICASGQIPSEFVTSNAQFAMLYDGNLTVGGILVSSNAIWIRVWSNAAENARTFQWVALYEGEYTAETLPEYQPKGYGAELAECQRYYQIRSKNDISAIDMRPLMRLENPTISEVSNGYAYSADL